MRNNNKRLSQRIKEKLIVKGKMKKPTYEEIEYNNKSHPSKTIAELILKEKILRKKKNISTDHHVKK
jgi:hypothetical protein